jgi:hypothetical protein
LAVTSRLEGDTRLGLAHAWRSLVTIAVSSYLVPTRILPEGVSRQTWEEAL